MPQFGAKLTDDFRVIIYNCNVFKIEATEEADDLSGLYYENILTIVSVACTIIVLLAPTLAFVSVINYARK